MRDLLIRDSFFFPLYTHPQKLKHLLRLLISISTPTTTLTIFTDIHYLFFLATFTYDHQSLPRNQPRNQDSRSIYDGSIISNDKIVSGLDRNFISHSEEKDNCVYAIPVGIRVRLCHCI